MPVVVEDVGSGPALILLHGLAGSTRWWARNIPELSRSFRVLAIDLPGFGSSRGHRRFDLDEVGAGIAGTMDRLEIERASVIGHSMGGLIAGGLAADHPGRVERLVLVDAAFLSLGWTATQFLTGPATTLRRTAPSLLPVLIADSLRAGPIRLADAGIQLLRADWRRQLPRISAPTLVLWGEHDAICPPAIGRAIVELIPDARLQTIDGGAHNPMWEQPESFTAAGLDFLGTVGDGRPIEKED